MSLFSGLVKSTLKLSAKGGLSRFAVESLVTPSLYPRLFKDKGWRQLILEIVTNHKREPREIIEVLERNVRFRTTARRRYMQESFKVSPLFRARFVDGEDAPSRSSLISGGFPEITKFKYLGDEDARRRELIAILKKASIGATLNDWTIEDVLESCGCYIHGTSSFNAFCEEEGIYDLYTQEYVDGLAKHLKGSRVVVEVGAGSGRLSHLLRKRLSPDTEVIATDSGSWARMKGHRPKYPVVKCDYAAALELYNPDVVIAAWIPMNQDWTLDFRKKTSVEEYILIGSPDSCGKSWDSWGINRENAFDSAITSLLRPPRPDSWPLDIFEWLSGSTGGLEPDIESDAAKKRPLYELEGFEKIELPDLCYHQLSRYDRITRSGNSRTVSFVRND